MAGSQLAYSTLHLNITGDVDSFEKDVDRKLKAIADSLGTKFQERFDEAFERGLGRELSRSVQQATRRVERTAPTVTVNVDADAKQAEDQLQKLERTERTVRAKLELDAAKAEQKLQRLEQTERTIKSQLEIATAKAQLQIQKFTSQEADLQVEVDAGTEGAEAKLREVTERRRIAELELSAKTENAQAKLAQVVRDRKITLEARADTAAAEAQLDFAARDRTVNIDIDTGRAKSAISALTGALGNLGSAGSSLGSLGGAGGPIGGLAMAAGLSTGILAVVGTLPLLATGLAAAGAAGGVAMLAFRGVGEALAEMEKNAESAEDRLQAQKAAADAVKSAQSGLASAQSSLAGSYSSLAGAQAALKSAQAAAAQATQQAAEQVRSAQQGIKDAYREAAEANEDAARRVQDAERSIVDAQRDAKRAQEDLNQARKDAADRLREYKDQLADGALNERQAILDVKEAEEELARVRADPTADNLDRERAQLRLDRTRQNLDETRRANRELQTEADEAKKKGVEGSDEVKDAKERLRDSNERVKDSERALADARDAQRQAQLDGQKAIELAEAALTQAREAQARTAEQNAASIANAQRAIEDSERGVADAQRGVADAQRGVNTALENAAVAGKAQTEAWDALSPAAQRFTKKIAGMREALDGLTAIAATAMFGKLTTALDMFGDNPKLGQGIRDLVEGVGGAIGDVAVKFAQVSSGKEGEQFVGFLKDTLPDAVRSLGDVGTQLARIGAALLKAMGPAGMTLLNDFAGWLERLANWMNSTAGQKELTAFFNDLVPVVRAVASLVADTFRLLWELWPDADALSNIARPFQILSEFLGFLGKFFDEHPDVARNLWQIGQSLSSFGLINWVSSHMDSILGFFEGLSNFDFRKMAGDFSRGGADLISGFAEGIGTGLSSLFANLPGWFTKYVIDPILGLFGIRSPSTVAKGWGGDIIQGLKDGFQEKLLGFWDSAKTWFTQHIVTPILSFFGIASPSTVAKGWGSDIIQGLKDGFREKLAGFWASAKLWFTDSIINPVLSFFGIKSPSTVAKQWGDDIIQGLKDGIQQKLSGFWASAKVWFTDHVVTPIKTFFGIQSPSTVAKQWGDDIIQGLKDGVREKLSGFWASAKLWFQGNIVDPVRSFFGLDDKESMFHKIGSSLSSGLANGIKSKAEEIKKAFVTPLVWVMRAVVNGGLIGGFNKLLSKLKLPESMQIPEINGSIGGEKFATGGYVRGPGSATSDSIPAMLSDGEFVIKARSVKKIGVARLNQLNQMGTDYGGDPGGVFVNEGYGRRGFAGGGLVESRVKRTKEWLPSVDPKPYVWGAVGPNAFDCSGLVGDVWARLTGNPTNRRYFTTSSNPKTFGFQKGKGTFTMGLQPGQHMAGNLGGLGFEARSTKTGIFVGGSAKSVTKFPQQWFLPIVGDQFVGGGAGVYDSSVGGEAASGLMGVLDAVVEKASNVPNGGAVIGPAVGQITKNIRAGIADLPLVGFLSKIAGKAWDSAKGLFSGVTGSVKDLAAGVGIGGGSGSGPTSPSGNQKIVKDMAEAMYGWKGAQWDALYQLVMHESGFRNTAQNPNSSAYGMFQFIDGTWQHYGGAKTSDPRKQTEYGLKYIKARYGDPGNAWRTWLSRDPHWYDNGGWLPPGDTWTRNNTGKPEAILTNEQWQAVIGGKDAPVKGDTIINVSTDDDRKIAEVIAREQAKHDLKLQVTGAI